MIIMMKMMILPINGMRDTSINIVITYFKVINIIILIIITFLIVLALLIVLVLVRVLRVVVPELYDSGESMSRPQLP